MWCVTCVIVFGCCIVRRAAHEVDVVGLADERDERHKEDGGERAPCERVYHRKHRRGDDGVSGKRVRGEAQEVVLRGRTSD